MFCSHVMMLRNRQRLLSNENELRLENQLNVVTKHVSP